MRQNAVVFRFLYLPKAQSLIESFGSVIFFKTPQLKSKLSFLAISQQTTQNGRSNSLLPIVRQQVQFRHLHAVVFFQYLQKTDRLSRCFNDAELPDRSKVAVKILLLKGFASSPDCLHVRPDRCPLTSVNPLMVLRYCLAKLIIHICLLLFQRDKNTPGNPRISRGI